LGSLSNGAIAQGAWVSRGEVKSSYDELKNFADGVSDAVGYVN
jgi:hypothetical protein